MSIIPTLRCRSMRDSIAFYTEVLDFDLVKSWPQSTDPSYGILSRNGHELHLSTNSGDGAFGCAVVVLTDDAEALLRSYRARGLPPSAKLDSPVHRGVIHQSWGTREFYVDDPSGNTLRFVQR
jgi:catechol 2,3-dioxygenase-like lactoylglutathione lyase family enzyme